MARINFIVVLLLSFFVGERILKQDFYFDSWIDTEEPRSVASIPRNHIPPGSLPGYIQAGLEVLTQLPTT